MAGVERSPGPATANLRRKSPRATGARGRSLWRDAAGRLARNRAALASAVVIVLLFAIALLAPRIAPYPFAKQDFLATSAGPDRAHLLGTDQLGRDELSRLVYGARISMSVAVITVAIVLGVGVPVGLLSGYYGGTFDLLLMRVVDVFYALPYYVVLILLQTYFLAKLPDIRAGPLVLLRQLNQVSGGLLGVFVGLSLFGWLNVARLVRGQVLTAKEQDFVLAARAVGARPARIIWQHLLPNVLAPVIVMAALLVPGFIIAEAGLSFIGLGAQPPTPSWGIMLADGVTAIESYPYQTLVPALAIAVTLLAFNFLGDGLRDALDPRMR
jgi:oligopeptide transport system permease protein